MKELDTVALTRNIEEYGLKEGDVGAIVHAHTGGAFEVEFVTAQGETVAVLTLTNMDVRPIEKREILHVREIDRASLHL